MTLTVHKNRPILASADISPTAADAFEKRLLLMLETKPAVIEIDCTPLKRANSSQVNLLWIAQALCQDRQVRLRLLNVSENLLRILEVLDLASLFEIEDRPATGKISVAFDKDLHGLPSSFSDAFPLSTADVEASVERFIDFLRGIGAGSCTVMELRTIYYEIVTNARLHGKFEDDHDVMLVSAGADLERIVLKFTDKANAFDPTSNAGTFDVLKATQLRKRRGFGLPMVRRLSDGMTYQRTAEEQNVLTITKKWRRQL